MLANKEALSKIEKLKYNWDECGALPISKEVINKVRILFAELKYESDIFPTPDGNIQLEYSKGLNRHLNIEILSNSSMVIFEMFDDRSVKESICSYDVGLIKSRVESFCE